MATPTSRKIVAQEAMKRAESNECLFAGSYSIQQSDMNRIGIPPIALENLSVGKGDEAGVFVDFERGMLVYDLQEGEYER